MPIVVARWSLAGKHQNGWLGVIILLRLRLLPTFRGQKNRFFLFFDKIWVYHFIYCFQKKNFKKFKKPPSYLEKTYFQIKLINYEGVIILSTGETPGEFFAANANRSYFISFAYLYLHHVLDKNSHVEALYANCYGKIRKNSLGKEEEKNVLQCDAFPGKSWSIVTDARRSCCSIGLWFYQAW